MRNNQRQQTKSSTQYHLTWAENILRDASGRHRASGARFGNSFQSTFNAGSLNVRHVLASEAIAARPKVPLPKKS